MSKGKRKIEITSAKISAFMSWLYTKYLFYGEPWVEWWKKYGSKDFAKWSAKKGLKYMKEQT